MTPDATNRKAILLPRGAYSRIARRLRPKVSPQHVRKVALGERKSARVMKSILKFAESLEPQGTRAA
jgi:hypothetical protein